MSEFHTFRAGSNGSGLMPTQFMLDKLESTRVYEQPRQLDVHFRTILRDEAPDAPYMEADAKREGSIMSTSRIALREGLANGKEDINPYLEDGLFLDQEFLNVDKSWANGGPNMQLIRKQKEARTKFIKYGNDSDESRPESGITPQRMQQNIRSKFAQNRSKRKIFAKTFENPSYKSMVLNQDAASRVALDNGQLDIEERTPSRTSRTGPGLTSDVRNDTEATAEFGIVHYGGKTGNNIKLGDAQLNRQLTGPDGRPGPAFADTRTVAQFTRVLENIISQKFEGAPADMVYHPNREQNNSGGLMPKYIGGVDSQQVVESRAAEIGRLMQNEMMRRSNRRVSNNESRIGTSDVSKALLQYADTHNRTSGPQQTQIRINSTEATAPSLIIKGEIVNRSAKRLEDSLALYYDSLSAHPSIEFKSVVNYSAAPSLTNMSRNYLDNGENYAKQSMVTAPTLQAKQHRVDHQLYNTDTRIGHERERFRSANILGSKYTQHQMENSHDADDVNDSANATRRKI